MDLIFLVALFIVAFLYSSVGHGGASGYLALMALFGIEIALMKPSALTLNLFVSSIAFISYYRGGHFRINILLPFAITSIPMAFLGATLDISPELYKKMEKIVNTCSSINGRSCWLLLRNDWHWRWNYS
jgi:uncharacterized membrane protein YfcA